jgi:hypothetical protein
VRAKVALVAAIASLVGSALVALASDETRFPHRKHAGLFPTCIGCHAAAIAGDSAPRFPEQTQCQGCHDGTQEERVSWTPPPREPTNLRFSHLEHIREMGMSRDSAALSCQTCHADAGPRSEAEAFMAVSEARPALCLECHAHRSPSHYAEESSCATCHLRLAEATDLPAREIERFPEPPSHDRPDFLTAHAPSSGDASCAYCHARESCERCHPNATTERTIAAIPRDARVARLVAARPGEYPTPASHRDPDFPYAHGVAARASISSCANCHAQPSCRSCHIGSGARKEIARLPRGDGGGAAGVILRARPHDVSSRESALAPATLRAAAAVPTDTTPRPLGAREVRVHPAGFAGTHGAAAASGQLGCEGCHAKKFCADCHDGEGRRRFHAPNFVLRHAADSYSRQRDCSTCHNPEVFCKSCHQSSGMASDGRRNVAFHTAQPLWLIQHGRAARQGLESCASCHAQRDCMQCHSTVGRGVNPHGSEFDAERMAKRNRQVCFACHLGDPLAP